MKANKEFIENTPINWYPGHMLKAKKELSSRLKQVDVVVELRDARIPLASVNQDFESLLKQKNRIILFNKTELADSTITQEWIAYFQKNNTVCRFIDVKHNQGISNILPHAKKLMQAKWERFERKGIRPPSLKLVVVGIPNVGKSSLINKLVKRHATAIGPTPGVTKRQEWVRLGKDVELLDTPGILWPKFESSELGFALAMTGAIKDRIVGEERLCRHFIQFHLQNYTSLLQAHYQISAEAMSVDQIMGMIGEKRGCLGPGGVVDLLRTSKMILQDFRSGKLGRISFETP